jgi:hypothetical protein
VGASVGSQSGRFEDLKEPYWAFSLVDIAREDLVKFCGRESQKQELIGSFIVFR